MKGHKFKVGSKAYYPYRSNAGGQWTRPDDIWYWQEVEIVEIKKPYIRFKENGRMYSFSYNAPYLRTYEEMIAESLLEGE